MMCSSSEVATKRKKLFHTKKKAAQEFNRTSGAFPPREHAAFLIGRGTTTTHGDAGKWVFFRTGQPPRKTDEGKGAV